VPNRWTLYARDAAGVRQGQIDVFDKLVMNPRHNAVGTWTLDMPASAPLAAAMTQDGWGIDCVSQRNTSFAGIAVGRRRSKDSASNTLQLWGLDDMAWLARRCAHPEPASAVPPYSTDAYDVRAGTCSTILRQFVDVNAGPSSIAQRRVPGLTLAVDPGVGSTVTGRGRWQLLIDLLRELADAGAVGFRMRRLAFEVFAPANKSASIIFSDALGNVAGFTYETAAPEANYLYTGGGGEGTARLIEEGQDGASIATWGRIEAFKDARDTAIAAELDQRIAQELAQASQGRSAVSITPVDTAGMQYGTHYDLGDKVTAVVDGIAIVDVVREVKITVGPAGNSLVQPQVGPLPSGDSLRLFSLYQRMQRDLRDLQRR
jgi:hypothetical protein